MLNRFFCLSGEERRMLVAAAFLVLAIRLGLKIFRFATVHRLMMQITPQVGKEADVGKAARDVIWAVGSTSRNIAQVTCLSQAYATQFLLAHRQIASNLRIGVIRGQNGQLEAHAWIEREGEVLVGDLPNLDDYSVFPSLENLTS